MNSIVRSTTADAAPVLLLLSASGIPISMTRQLQDKNVLLKGKGSIQKTKWKFFNGIFHVRGLGVVSRSINVFFIFSIVTF